MKKAFLSLLAVSLLGLGGCVSDDTGTIHFSWSLTVNNVAGTCAQVGATNITVFINAQQPPTEFDCRPSGSVDLDIDPGTYTVEIQITDLAGTRLNSVPIIQTVTVRSGRTENLGNFNFAFTVNFGAVFTVRWGSDNGTCSSAGVVNEWLDITSLSSSQCIAKPVTAGGAAAGQSCMRTICKEGNVQRIIDDLSPGQYLVSVIGFKGGVSATPTPCYYSNQVPCDTRAGDCNLGAITAIFDPLQADEQVCNAKPSG